MPLKFDFLFLDIRQ